MNESRVNHRIKHQSKASRHRSIEGLLELARLGLFWGMIPIISLKRGAYLKVPKKNPLYYVAT